MKNNHCMKKRFCFQKACTMLIILLCVQVTTVFSKTTDQPSGAALQAQKVTGTVTDASTGEPIAGANIVIDGTTIGVVSDVDGKFTLEINKSDAVIVVSFLGYNSERIVVGTQTTLDVKLVTDIKSLEEVVVVGYGATQKKATLTGSVASIKNEDLVITKNENVLNMLTGKLPGVRVVQKSAAPGAYNTVIDIRSMGTPLFVIDGVTRDQEYFARMDPSEIDNISVLKDGSAAIYGLRAGNGVVLVTTKRGSAQQGKVDITYTANYSTQQFLYVPEGVSALDYMLLRNESVFQNFNNNYLVRQNPYFTQDQMQPYIDGKPSYNWMDAVFNKNSPQQQHNLSINGGNDKLRYFMSLGYFTQDGSYSSGDYSSDRWNFRSSVDADITKRLKAKLSLGAILDKTTMPNGTGWSTYKSAWLMRPDAPIYANDNPEYLNGDASVLYDGHNMLAEINSDMVGYNINNRRRFDGSLQLSYDIPGIKGLSAKGSYDYAASLPDATSFRKTYMLYVYNSGNQTYTSTTKNAPSTIERSSNFNFDTNMQLGLHYNNKFGNHNLNSFLIYEEGYSKWDNFSAYRELLVASEYLFAGEDLNQRATGGTPGDRSSKSVIGSLTYDFSGKYLFDFRFRYDGNSRFPKGSQFGFFPSVSAGWRISEENFIKNNFTFISNLKLRASYGEMGDDNAASNYPPTMGYSIAPSTGSSAMGWMFNNVWNGGIRPQAIPNPNLTWLTIKMYNAAVDFGMLNNKISGTFEIYRRDRTGLLATSSAVVPGTVGATLPQENLNADRNFGWELSMDYRDKISDFNYSVGGQISKTRSMRTDWLETVANNQYHHWRNRTSGRYNDIWWGNESDHMFTTMEEIRTYKLPMGQGATPGDWINNDWNEDGVIDANDDHPIATNGLPKFNYGINLGASWKNIDLTMNFQGAYGVYVQYGELLTSPLSFNGQNTLSYFLDRWRPEDPNADYFSPSTTWIPGFYPVTSHDGRRTGSNLVQNSSYMRLKTLELGYSLPKKIVTKLKIDNFRVYVSGYNLLTFTKLKNADPERGGDNPDVNSTPYVDYYSYPVNKTFTIGASVKF